MGALALISMKRISQSLGALGIAATLTQVADAAQLIVNGGFETGNFSGWTTNVQSGSQGNLFVESGQVTPISGHTTAGPASGSYYAVTDQPGPGSYSLTQSFTIAPGTSSESYSFDLFANAYASFSTTAPIRDYTVQPNENVVVDILTAGSNPFTTNTANIVATLYGPAVSSAAANPWTLYSGTLNLAPGTYEIRFAETDNQGFLNMGVDNVSLQASPVPLPAGVWLMLSGLGGLGAMTRKRKAA